MRIRILSDTLSLRLLPCSFAAEAPPDLYAHAFDSEEFGRSSFEGTSRAAKGLEQPQRQSAVIERCEVQVNVNDGFPRVHWRAFPQPGEGCRREAGRG